MVSASFANQIKMQSLSSQMPCIHLFLIHICQPPPAVIAFYLSISEVFILNAQVYTFTCYMSVPSIHCSLAFVVAFFTWVSCFPHSSWVIRFTVTDVVLNDLIFFFSTVYINNIPLTVSQLRQQFFIILPGNRLSYTSLCLAGIVGRVLTQ